MSNGVLTDYNFVASLTAQLRSGTRQQFAGLTGGVSSASSSASAAAADAADALVASRMGEKWQQVTSVSVDSLDIFV